jgi:RNase P/RNase MRP subunit p30
LIAIKTTDVNVFKEACRIYNIDIISFYFNERMSFELSAVDIKKALERNIYFELCYANAIRGMY